MDQKKLAARVATALLGAIAISFIAGQLSVGHGAAAAVMPARPAPDACRLPAEAPPPPVEPMQDPPVEPPSPHGFNQPG